MTQDVTGNGGFVEAYSMTTGRRQMVPGHWINDPVLGVDFRLTPFQRELNGELGPRPRQDSTVKDIEAYADNAGIDLSAASTKDEKLAAIEAVFGRGDVQTGMVPVEEPTPVEEPAAAPVSPSDVDTSPGTSPDDGAPSTEPSTTNQDATGGQEN